MTSLLRRCRSSLLVVLALMAWRPPLAGARTYNLNDLLELARKNNPGLAASAQATVGVEAQLAEANRSWMPSGEVLSLLAPVPEIRCENDVDNQNKTYREENCIRTNRREAALGSAGIGDLFAGVFTRSELRLVQPLFTFGKIAAGKTAARQGVAASRDREAGVAADLELNIKRAYYGLKFARAAIETINEGIEKLEDAQKHVENELKAGTGAVTQIDRLRLKTVRADVAIRLLEAKRKAEVARSGLRVLIGPEAPQDLDVDSAPLEPVNVPTRPLPFYEQQARLSRPEVRALQHLVASKQALADLEKRKQFPDLVLLGSATVAYASSIDNPANAFANDPFNTFSGGLAAAIRVPLDLGIRNARAAKLRAEADETALRRVEALGGIAFEVQRAYGELTEAQERLAAVRDGEKASKAWVTAVTVNFTTGLAETKDFTDALVQFFLFRIYAQQAMFDLNVAAAALERATGAEVVVR